MASGKPKGRGAKPAAPLGTWDTLVAPFLARHSILLATLLVFLASVRIVSTYSELSLTFDEPGHFACGLEYLQKHIYKYESQHPPLSRAAMALGPFLAGIRLIGGPQRDDEGRAVIKATGNVDRTAFLMRIGILPFFWLASIVVYLWTARYTSRDVAVLAVGIFSLTPPVLAHAGLATTDMALTACLAAAFYALEVWAESPTWRHAAWLGVAAALAALSKFTAFAYLPAATVLALVLWLALRRPSGSTLVALARGRFATFGFAVVVGALCIWAAYWFSFGTVPVWNVTLPAPELFDGIRSVSSHNNFGNSAYLLGETSMHGWWYFFPAAIAFKTPIAILLLSAIGFWTVWTPTRAPYLAFLLGALLPAMAGNINIGVRHVLPVYVSFAILAALGLATFCRWAGTSTALPTVAACTVAWLAISGGRAHPDYLAYFNEFAGREPEMVLVDSDLDWGQEIKRLARRLREVHADHVAIKLNEAIIPEPLYPLPHPTEVDDFVPTPGWNAISATAAKHVGRSTILTGIDPQSIARARQGDLPWYERTPPTERVGGLLLYYVPGKSTGAAQ